MKAASAVWLHRHVCRQKGHAHENKKALKNKTKQKPKKQRVLELGAVVNDVEAGGPVEGQLELHKEFELGLSCTRPCLLKLRMN